MKIRYLLIILAGIAVLFWIIGLMQFVAQIEAMAEPAIGPGMETTDAIVVLTGGSDRVATGLALLQAGKGKKLFISGVHHGLTLDNILGSQPVAKELRACCIALGHAAGSTRGNADETRTWLALEDDHSMRLVTANYHMPRSLLIFRAAMPDITIVPHPVTPESVKFDEWWEHPGTASLLVTEYIKYQWAIIRLWADEHE